MAEMSDRTSFARYYCLERTNTKLQINTSRNPFRQSNLARLMQFRHGDDGGHGQQRHSVWQDSSEQLTPLAENPVRVLVY
jgi:hypothetical protein